MRRKKRDYIWIAVFALLTGFAIPWALWGASTTIIGLPIWLWWHIAVMLIASVSFSIFTRGAWDRGMAIDPQEVKADD